ncbi:hypothetical protein V1511DRAFT_508293 [Dipodascopsis uninucleata]
MSSKKPAKGYITAPPTIPHSEELKYRQKCKDLKKRIREVEEQNDVLTLRLTRSKRAVQRMRLERAFLLEKLEERTFLKAEDSEGSPSPPPSPPRNHRHKRRDSDASLSAGESATTGFVAFNNSNNSKSHSQTGVNNSHHSGSAKKKSQPPRDPNAPKRPQNAYIIFCDHEKERVRAQLEQSMPGEAFDLTKAMAEAWRDLGDEGRKRFYDLYDAEKARYNREMEAYVAPGSVPIVASSGAGNGSSSKDGSTTIPTSPIAMADDVDMKSDDNNYGNDTQKVEDEVGEVEGEEEVEDVGFGGFTAVNKR